MKQILCDNCKQIVCSTDITVVRCPYCGTDIMNRILHLNEGCTKVDDGGKS